MHLLNTLLGTTGGRSYSTTGKYMLSLRCCLMTILKLLQWWELLVYCVDELKRFCLVVKRDVRPSTGIDSKWLLKEVRRLTMTFFPSAILHFSIITEL